MKNKFVQKKTISIYMSKIGKIGGKSGTGKAKKRGDSEYYSRLAKKRWCKKRKTKN